MDPARSSKLSARTAAEVCEHYRPSKEARKLLQADWTPLRFVEELVRAVLYADAVEFLAHALPKREAIWWACLGTRYALGADQAPDQFAALKAAVEWVLEPDEPKRRAAQTAGEAVGFDHPGGLAALAVYGSGGSLGPPEFPEVPPGPYMTAQAVSGSIAMASAAGPQAGMPDIGRELVELGIAIAEGSVTWPAATKAPATTAAAGHAPASRF
jgi:hypothetical protein